MDQLFGDATTAMPTPAQEAEVESLMSASRSPVPSLDIRRPGTFTSDAAIPGLDINPPKDGGEDGVADGKRADGTDGIGGWISRMVKRGRATSKASGTEAGSYRRLGQQDDERGG